MTHDPTIKLSCDQGLFCGATDYPILDFVVPLPMGFKARVVLLLALLLACAQWT